MIALDTNLLVYAHRAGCPEHEAARHAIEDAASRENGLGIPAACVFEFWSVVTHPSSVGGGSSPASARGFIQALIETAGATVLPPPAALVPRCMQLAEQLDVRGPRVFDLQIGLAALDAGVTEIWTHDPGFVALPGMKIRDPLQEATRTQAAGAP